MLENNAAHYSSVVQTAVASLVEQGAIMILNIEANSYFNASDPFGLPQSVLAAAQANGMTIQSVLNSGSGLGPAGPVCDQRRPWKRCE